MAIRYDQKLQREIARTVKNFNAKITRLEKKNFDTSLLPDRISSAQLKESYMMRKDLKRRLKQLQSFSNRGSEQIVNTLGGARTTVYQLRVTKADVRRAKMFYSRQLNKIGGITPTVFGKKQARTLSQMGSEEVSNIRAKLDKLNKAKVEKLSQTEFERMSAFAQLQIANIAKKNFILYQNYFEMIDKVVYMGNLDREKGEYLKQKLATLSPNQFIELFNTEKSIGNVIDYYMELKLQSGVVSDEDKKDLAGLFDNLVNIIDELVEQYE